VDSYLVTTPERRPWGHWARSCSATSSAKELEKKIPKRPPLVSDASTLRERSEGTWVMEKLLRVVQAEDARSKRSSGEERRRPRIIGC
jgi:hypothetical protein